MAEQTHVEQTPQQPFGPIADPKDPRDAANRRFAEFALAYEPGAPSAAGLEVGQAKMWIESWDGLAVKGLARGNYAVLSADGAPLLVARECGVAGNDVSLTQVIDDPGEELTISVDGKDITVHLQSTSAPVAAAGSVLAFTPAYFDTHFTDNASDVRAVMTYIGTSGNGLHIRFTAGSIPASLDGVFAELANVRFTAAVAGSGGNAITVYAQSQPETDNPNTVVGVFGGTNITIYVATAAGKVVGTYQDVIDAWNANSDVTALASIEQIAGAGSDLFTYQANNNVLIFNTTSLIGGFDIDDAAWVPVVAGSEGAHIYYSSTATADDLIAWAAADPVNVGCQQADPGVMFLHSLLYLKRAPWNNTGTGLLTEDYGDDSSVTFGGTSPAGDVLELVARTPGAAGNSIHIITEPNGTDVQTTHIVEVDGSSIYVMLARTAMVPATVLDPTNHILFTSSYVFEYLNGHGGSSLSPANGISVYAGAGGYLYEVFAGTTTADLQAHLDADGSTQTVQDFIDWVNNTSGAPFTAELAQGGDGSALLQTSNGDGNLLMPFVGGSGAVVTGTVAEVKAAIEGDTDANALVECVEGGNWNPDALPDWGMNNQLDNGVDAGIDMSDMDEVANLINADPAASALVYAQVASDSPAGTLGQSFLSGGDDDALHAFLFTLGSR